MVADAAWPPLVVAVTVTVCWVDTHGAVYSPVLEMLPALEGLTDQVTDPLATAVNCWVCPPESVEVVGVTVIGGRSVTVAVAVSAGVPVVVAVTVTVCCVAIVAGAV